MINFIKACFTGPPLYRIFSLFLILQIIIWVAWNTKISKTEQSKKTNNGSTGFDIKAKRSEIEGNIAMDHKTGFKADIEDSTFKKNISKGTISKENEQIPTNDKSIKEKINDQNKTKGVMMGNVIINCGTAVSGQFNDTEIKHNLTDGNILNEKTIAEKINILDRDLANLEKTKGVKSIFEQASYYQITAEGYAAYGEWEKAINCAYQSFDLYLKIPEGDSNPIFKTKKDKEEAALYVCAKLNFYSNTVRKETDKNYTYFLNRLVKLAKEDANTRGIKLIEERIALQK